jgi:hypothetical protein
VVNPDFEVTAKKAIFATLSGGGDSNIVLDAPRIVSTAYLTDASKFYLFNMDGALKPFIFQAREPLSRQTKGLDDLETKDVKFMTEARYNLGFGAWWKAHSAHLHLIHLIAPRISRKWLWHWSNAESDMASVPLVALSASGMRSRMTFKKDEPLSLNDNEFSSVMGDIGKSLVYCKTDSDGNPINKPDWEATKADAPK